MTTTNKEIGREFRFCWHIPAPDKETTDWHFIKELIHYEDGTKKPSVRMIKDFKRPVWFTKPHLRTHKDKREFEALDNLNELNCRQSDIKTAIALQINKGFVNPRQSIRDLCSSPYVYGADIPSSLFIRDKLYTSKYPDLAATPFSVAALDTESDVVNGTEEIIIATYAFNDKCYAYVQKSFLKGYSDPEGELATALDRHLQSFREKGAEFEVEICEDQIEVIRKVFLQAHKDQPDFLAIWNINHDIPLILRQIEKAGLDPKDILCDPRLPKELRLCRYKEGQVKKVSASNVKQTIAPQNQWHVLELTASFYVICGMATYRRVRGGAEFSSYSLDATLKREISVGKITLPEAEKYHKLKWHHFMQSRKQFDYIAYALFDAYSVVLLNRKTKDLSHQLPVFAGFTNFSDYSSQSKRQRDSFFLYGWKNKNIVLASAGPVSKEAKVYVSEDGEEEEYETLGRDGWVVTLRSFMSLKGLPLIEESSKLPTMIRTHNFDNDVVSSYPKCIFVANVSKSTTMKEITGMSWGVDEVPEYTYRMQNLNFAFGRTNHAEYVQTLFKAPNFLELCTLMEEDLAKT